MVRVLMVMVMVLGAGSRSWATDGATVGFDVGSAPDLLEVLGGDDPLMGQCPMGDRARGSIRPGAHLLHLGVTGFFLDYRKTLGLSDSQATELVAVRDRALSRSRALDADIRSVEEKIWNATGSASDEKDLSALVRESERLRADRRLLLILAVRRAAAVLTPEQRRELAGRAHE